MSNPIPFLGDIYQVRFDNGEFDLRDASLIFYGKYERVMEVIGADISIVKQQLDTLIGGTS